MVLCFMVINNRGITHKMCYFITQAISHAPKSAAKLQKINEKSKYLSLKIAKCVVKHIFALSIGFRKLRFWISDNTG